MAKTDCAPKIERENGMVSFHKNSIIIHNLIGIHINPY